MVSEGMELIGRSERRGFAVRLRALMRTIELSATVFGSAAFEMVVSRAMTIAQVVRARSLGNESGTNSHLREWL